MKTQFSFMRGDSSNLLCGTAAALRLPSLLLLMLATLALAEDFTYMTNKGTITVKDHKSAEGWLTMPKSVPIGTKVTSIGAVCAFIALLSRGNVTIQRRHYAE